MCFGVRQSDDGSLLDVDSLDGAPLVVAEIHDRDTFPVRIP